MVEAEPAGGQDWGYPSCHPLTMSKTAIGTIRNHWRRHWEGPSSPLMFQPKLWSHCNYLMLHPILWSHQKQMYSLAQTEVGSHCHLNTRWGLYFNPSLREEWGSAWTTSLLYFMPSLTHTSLHIQQHIQSGLSMCKAGQGDRDGRTTALGVRGLGSLVVIKSKEKIYGGLKRNKGENHILQLGSRYDSSKIKK